MDYRDKLKTLRKENSLRQIDIAKICKVSVKTVSHWETRRIEMPISCVIRLCQHYKVSSDYILGLNECHY